MSKRKDLLEVALSEEKNVSVVIAATLVKDLKFLKRAIRDLEDVFKCSYRYLYCSSDFW